MMYDFIERYPSSHPSFCVESHFLDYFGLSFQLIFIVRFYLFSFRDAFINHVN